jgi:ABC-type transport system involved in cytochrome bd biosynthesis fused ATPase/permease subunit
VGDYPRVPDGGRNGYSVIEAQHLTKRYGERVAVDDLSFTVRPGTVTGFLGPNGSGKSTTMRMIVGLDHPNAGRATVNGRPYRELRWPLREVGALLEAKAVHPGRSAWAHLWMLAETNDIPRSRVDEVIAMVGLELMRSALDGYDTVLEDDGSLSVRGVDEAVIGEIAARHGVVLHELAPQAASLEEAFMELTNREVEYRGTTGSERGAS